MVITITSEKHFSDLLLQSSVELRLLVVDFFTTWCVPCKLFAPEYDKLSIAYEQGAYFAKVDCDILSDLAIKQNVSKIPTLKGFLNTNNAFTISGAINMESVTKAIEDHIIVPCLKSLHKKNIDIKARTYLLKLSNNIINFPNEEKYRQLKLSNKAVKENLLAHDGVLECLLSLGFTKEENRLYMPIGNPIDNLRTVSKQLSLLLERSVDKPVVIQSNNANVKNSDQGTAPSGLKNIPAVDVKLTTDEMQFINSIKSIRKSIQRYEDPDIMNMVNVLVDMDSYKSTPLTEEAIVRKVLNWFKYEFFTWFTPPICSLCSKPYASIGSTSPTAEESVWLSGNVELYKCSSCPSNSEVFRFPRYNHPEKLLITRTGRCGEWANCFSMIIRAFINEGLLEKARFVNDWSDHVWCEIYMKLDAESEKRWIHVDPCENAYNTPLVYQVGWNKKISYVIGVTLVTGDVQDITWRYTNDFRLTLLNRTLIREDALIQNLIQFHKYAKTDPKEVVSELVSFLSDSCEQKEASENEKIGRTTGSVEWRAVRGELGQQPPWTKESIGQSITPTALEISNNCVHIQYNCSTDQYYRPSNSESKTSISAEGEVLSSSSGSCQRKASTHKGGADLLSHDTENWQMLAASWKNIKRKVEYDWQIVYLARVPDCTADASGEIKWTIDLTGTNKVIGEISVFASSAEFSNASVRWRLQSGPRQVSVNGFVTTLDFNDCSVVSLTASLESEPGSRDRHCWQHAQLCRQKSTDFDVKTLQIKVELHDP